LLNFILISLQFENSFLQQVIDKIKNNKIIFDLFTDVLFTKFFRGRNISIKTNDLKHLIKFTINYFGPFYFFNKLSKFLLNKEKGGARTTHQVNQIFNLMTYTVDLTNNKLKDENCSQFRQQYINLENEDLIQFGKNILNIIKENLKTEEKPAEEEKLDVEESKEEEKNDQKDKKDKKKKKKKNKQPRVADAKTKNSYFFIGLISFYEKYISLLTRTNLTLSESEKAHKNIQSVSNVLIKVAEDYELKNMHKKISEIKEKVSAQN
jgi:hypothetical protein